MSCMYDGVTKYAYKEEVLDRSVGPWGPYRWNMLGYPETVVPK